MLDPAGHTLECSVWVEILRWVTWKVNNKLQDHRSRIYAIFQCQLLVICTWSNLGAGSPSMQKLEAGQGKNTTFYFAKSFCCFRLNKSVLETAETKEADSQLYFAPKIIKNHLLVFENELIEDTMLVPKKSQNWKLVFSHVLMSIVC